MDIKRHLRTASTVADGRIGFLGTFASAAMENAFRQRHFRDSLWLCRFLVGAAILRVALFLVADYQDFGVGPVFWPLLAIRLFFIALSGWVLVALGRANLPSAAEKLFFVWCILLAALTVFALSARPPSNTGLLFMSFGAVLVVYCVTPLPLLRQLILALGYSAAALLVSRHADGETLLTVGMVYVMSNVFGAVTSWWLNHKRREAFLGGLRESELRANLEEAMAEIKTLRGMHCICAWCKRIRDEAERWQPVEHYVQSRTHAAFTHGICPECLQSQVGHLN